MQPTSANANMGLSLQSRMEQVNRMPSDEQVKYAAQQFEAVFLRQILDDALKPMFKGCLDESGADNDIYRSYVVDGLADSMSTTGCFGFSTLLQTQLQPPAQTTPASPLSHE